MALKMLRNDKAGGTNQDIYLRACERVLAGYRDNPDMNEKEVNKKLIFYGVNVVNGSSLDTEPIERRFQFAESIKALMATVTPKEFMNIFPVTKEYDGAKWEMKDYFYTMTYINGLDQNEPIGAKIVDLLWEYRNPNTQMFLVHLESHTSAVALRNEYSEVSECAVGSGTKCGKPVTHGYLRVVK